MHHIMIRRLMLSSPKINNIWKISPKYNISQVNNNNTSWMGSKFVRFVIPGATAAFIFYLVYGRQRPDISSNKQQTQAEKMIEAKLNSRKSINQQEKYQQFLKRSKQSIFDTISFACIHILRFFHLMLIFLPTIVLYPLRLFKKTRNYWMDTFVTAVERAGVVWIKSFQYLSHRRDIIGIDMAEKFTHLRENAPQHSFQETKRHFKETYGKQINEIFEQFDTEPIASGSVSQVYKAKYQGKKVAVKVRHPDVQKYISLDINLLFFFSRLLSVFSKSFSIPVTQISMKKTLNQQINFVNQKQNLIIFNQQFKNRSDITFPEPFQKDSNDSFLIETFVEGVPITYFQKSQNQHALNPIIARLGAQTFFDMLIKHNFIHADAHGGNLMVSIKQKSQSFFSPIWQYIQDKLIILQDKIIASTIQSQLLRKLYKQGSQQAAQIRKIIREAKQRVMLIVIDTGMVITLDQTDRYNFISFIKNVIHGDGVTCAKMIYNLSKYDNQKIREAQFPGYYQRLEALFQVINDKDLENLPGLELFTELLAIIRDYDMKLEGQFATLLTNMLVLQGLAKDINPSINILKIALPYFNKLQTDKAHQIHQPHKMYEL